MIYFNYDFLFKYYDNYSTLYHASILIKLYCDIKTPVINIFSRIY